LEGGNFLLADVDDNGRTKLHVHILGDAVCVTK